MPLWCESYESRESFSHGRLRTLLFSFRTVIAWSLFLKPQQDMDMRLGMDSFIINLNIRDFGKFGLRNRHLIKVSVGYNVTKSLNNGCVKWDKVASQGPGQNRDRKNHPFWAMTKVVVCGFVTIIPRKYGVCINLCTYIYIYTDVVT